MSRRSCAPRVPRARIDPIRNADDALAVLQRAAGASTRARTLVLLLDRTRIGSFILDVTGTEAPEAFVEIVDWAAGVACPVHMSALVVLSVRSGGGVVDLDVDRWLEASAVADRHGFELVEWFVRGPDGVECPRDLLGEPERW
jgi:hypothetical protein